MDLEESVDVGLRVDSVRAALADKLRDGSKAGSLDVLLESLAKRLETFRDTREESIHTLKVLILVIVEELLEVVPHSHRVVADQDLFAFRDDALARVVVEVVLHPVLLLRQPLLRLLQVLGNHVPREEGFRFLRIALLSDLQEWYLEMLLVDLIRDLVNVALVQTERSEWIDNILDEGLVDRLAVPLTLDETKESARQLYVPETAATISH